MNNAGYTSLFNRNSSGYTALFSSSKGGESAGTLAFGPSGTSVSYGGDSAGTLAYEGDTFSGGKRQGYDNARLHSPSESAAYHLCAPPSCVRHDVQP